MVGVVLATADHSQEGAAGIGSPTSVPNIPTDQVGPDAKRWLEGAKGPVLHGEADEQACARQFASTQPDSELRLVQPATVDGKRATVIGLPGGSAQEVKVFVVTGCSASGGIATPFYDTTVTLRNR